MPRPDLALLAAPLALLIAGCGGLPRSMPGTLRPSPSPTIRDDRQRPEPAPVVRDLLDHHNRIRDVHDLPPLSLSPKLAGAAREHVSGMIELGKARHRGVDGSTPADRVRRQDYPFDNVGENVAAGQETVDLVMIGWMDSPGHRKNILGDFEQMGASRDEDDDGRPYWCVVFATPLPQLDPGQAASGLVSKINELRAEESRRSLQAVEDLMNLAREHARAMARAGSLDPPRFSILDEIKQRGLSYRRVATAVSSGPADPAGALDSLSKNPRRRQDLLGDFDRIGVGYANDDDGRPYWSVIVLKKPS